MNNLINLQSTTNSNILFFQKENIGLKLNTLPLELFQLILSNLKPNDYQESNTICKLWNVALINNAKQQQLDSIKDFAEWVNLILGDDQQEIQKSLNEVVTGTEIFESMSLLKVKMFDLFEETHLIPLLNFLSVYGFFDQAKIIFNALTFINKADYRTNKRNDLYLKKIENSKICNFELNLHACSLAKIGYDSLALMLADLIQGNEQKNSCHKDISIKLLEKGYVDKAIKIAIQVPAHFYKNEELNNLLILTKYLAVNGFKEKAHEIINALPNDLHYGEASDKRILLANLKANFSK